MGALPERFLLAVTKDKVHAFKCRGKRKNLRLLKQIAVFDRGEIRLRVDALGDLFLEATENGRTRAIDLDGEVVDENPGAAEVLAALRSK